VLKPGRKNRKSNVRKLIDTGRSGKEADQIAAHIMGRTKRKRIKKKK